MGLNSIYLTLNLTVNKNRASRNIAHKVRNSASGIHILFFPLFLFWLHQYAEAISTDIPRHNNTTHRRIGLGIHKEIQSLTIIHAYGTSMGDILGIREHRSFVTGNYDGNPRRSTVVSLFKFKKTSVFAAEECSLIYISGQPEWWELLSGRGYLCPASDLDLGKAAVVGFISKPVQPHLYFLNMGQARDTLNTWVEGTCGTTHPLLLRYRDWADLFPLHDITSLEA